MTPMRTSSLKHMVPEPKTPRSIYSKENIPQSSQSSPRKPLKEIATNDQFPEDLFDTRKTQDTENQRLRARINSLELLNSQIQSSNKKCIGQLQSQVDSAVSQNTLLQTQLESSSKTEVERLSEELKWHSKLHLYAEKERIRLLDLLEFSGCEGKFQVNEVHFIREKCSQFSLASDTKCLV
jgi:hypothetical protein